jgi:hypothetical protein
MHRLVEAGQPFDRIRAEEKLAGAGPFRDPGNSDLGTGNLPVRRTFGLAVGFHNGARIWNLFQVRQLEARHDVPQEQGSLHTDFATGGRRDLAQIEQTSYIEHSLHKHFLRGWTRCITVFY